MNRRILIIFLLSGLFLTSSCFLHRKAQTDDNFIYMFVDHMPEYPGGDDAMLKFLSQNIIYPQIAKETGITGTVYSRFVVEKDGSVSDVNVLKGIGGGCDEEVVRVVKLMPKWSPGLQEGKKVRVQFNLPVKFTLE